MAERPEPGVFLEKQSYRRRRLLDGLKLLPVIGAWLFLLPLLWPDGGAHAENPKPMSSALIYVFGAWFFMIASGAALIAALKRRTPKGQAISDKGTAP